MMDNELTPLKALEKIRQAEYFVDFELDTTVGKDYKNELDIIEKSLKALEIIEKCCLLGAYPNGTYELAFSTKIDITKEEYDILKEIL